MTRSRGLLRGRRAFAVGAVACLAAGCSSAAATQRHALTTTTLAPPTTTLAPSTTTLATTTTTLAPTTTTLAPTTTTLAPTAFEVGITEVTWVNPDGMAEDYATGALMPRTLVTEIRYPTLVGNTARETPGAAPDRRFAPYPVIVFAHGYAVTPDLYQPLLDAWVKAGFVVVAPLFPDENGNEVASLGGVDSTAGYLAQDDLVNEPGDLAFVIRQIVTAAGASPRATVPPAVSLLRGLVDPRRIALAGQSDGATAVAGLAYDSYYSSLREDLATRPLAVAALSGAEFEGRGHSYGETSGSVPLLVVQSATDQCNLPEFSTQLYAAVRTAKWFLELDDATHIGPYAGLDDAAPVVESVTADFFETELGWHAPAPATLERAGDVPGISSASASEDPPTIAPLQAASWACAP